MVIFDHHQRTYWELKPIRWVRSSDPRAFRRGYAFLGLQSYYAFLGPWLVIKDHHHHHHHRRSAFQRIAQPKIKEHKLRSTCTRRTRVLNLFLRLDELVLKKARPSAF